MLVMNVCSPKVNCAGYAGFDVTTRVGSGAAEPHWVVAYPANALLPLVRAVGLYSELDHGFARLKRPHAVTQGLILMIEVPCQHSV